MNNKRFIKPVCFSCILSTSILSSSLSLAQEASALEEIVVTGSFIKRKQQADSTSPIEIIELKDIADIGAFNPVDIVSALTVNAGAQNNNDGFNQTFSLGTTNVNLRGLGVSSTLTLLNGRRQTSTAATTLNGDQFTDLNSLIPTIAIEHVEVLEDGASTLYGSDAVAGVVNFISRKSFEGVEVDLDYKTTSSDSQEDAQLSLLFGKNFGNTNFIAAISLFDRSALSAADRRGDFKSRDANSIFGSPGTFLAFSAGPPESIVDPSCLSVASSNPETTTGIVPPGNCGFDFGDFFSLVAKEERLQSYFELNSQLGENEFFVELGYTNNEVVSTSSPTQPILFPPFVPTSNPAFTDPALSGVAGATGAIWFGRVEGTGSAPSIIDIESETTRFATGLRGDINDIWSWQTALSFSENIYNYTDGSDTLVDRFTAALLGVGGPNNNQFYNPIFGATNDPAVREDFRGTYAFEATSTLTTLDAHVTGEVGSIGVAAGIQIRNSELEYDYNDAAEQDNLFFFRGNDSFKSDEDVFAFFVETDIPATENFNIQAAVRYEDLGDFDSTDPKLGFLWKLNQVNFRGSVSTSFRAPSIFQTSGGLTAPARIVDPVAGGFATISQRTEGDSNIPLKPQESDAMNLGLTWVNDTGLTLSADYWRFEYTDFITPENATAVVNVDPNGPQVTRVGGSPTGELVAVTTFFRNAGKLETDGLDLSISQDIGDTFKTVLNITQVLTYDLDDPVSGQIDGLGQRNFTNFGVPTPELRANLGLLWVNNVHAANVFYRHIDSYIDENNNNANVDSFGSVDAQYRYDMPNLFKDDQGLELIVGVKNLFDELAPDVASRSGYDTLTHNPLGRQVYLSLKAKF